METSSPRQWDWLSAFLLFLLMEAATARLVATGWAPFLYFAETLGAMGVMLGLTLGYSKFNRTAVVWLAIGYTAVMLPWLFTGAAEIDVSFLERLGQISHRLLVALDQFLRHTPVKDTLFFVVLVSLGFWLIGLASGYWLTRRDNALVGTLLAGLAILIVQAYDNIAPGRSWWVAGYVLVALLLLGRQYYLRNKTVWSRQRVFVTDDAWPDIFNGLLMITLIVVLSAWILPTSLSSLRSAQDAWNRMTRPLRDRLSDAVSSLKSPYGNGNSTSFYGETLPLGQDAAQGDTTVFTVKLISGPKDTPRFYWRGRVYDLYNNGQWTNSISWRQNFDPGDGSNRLAIADPNNRQDYHLAFTLQFPEQALLYVPSEPVWVDRKSTVTAAQAGEGQSDPIAWEVSPPIESGGQYQVRAEIANPNAQRLRQAGTDYPDWVKTHYLQVPPGLVSDLKALAEQAALGQVTPFDKASAVTAYLRDRIKYSTKVSAPPRGRDPIIWMLLDNKQGFCNYYATAEVLMLRSIGIPARLAVGFAEGDYDENQKVYTVHEREAHAWPEVYFPNIGWVEFEPTTSQFPLTRPDAASQNEASQGSDISPSFVNRDKENEGISSPGQSFTNAITRLPFIRTPAGLATVIGLTLAIAALVTLAIHRFRAFKRLPVYLSNTFERGGFTSPAWIENWSRWNQLEPVERSFASINWSLRRLGRPQPIDATPAERATLLKELLPAASEHIETLAFELESGLFTPRPADIRRARRASFHIVFHTVRNRLLNLLGANDGRDVYSR